jgi:dihydrodipicolinate synthase/N-acetylneuraminate lyase
MSKPTQTAESVRGRLKSGMVIPAHPLALNDNGQLDVRHQRALTRYYHAAGAGGIAVGVHTTQFAIRDPKHALLKPVLELAAETANECAQFTGRNTLLIAGICGSTAQAIREAEQAQDLGYDAGLLSLAALPDASAPELAAHAREIATVIPILGFYLQPAAGGRFLSRDFWRQFAEIPNVVGIKIAPFNRYQTLDVIHAVADSGRANDIALYTGNDDNIVIDLLTEFEVPTERGNIRLNFSGGLLGHWACWTKRAVELLHECKEAREAGSIPSALLIKATQITEANATLFDAANGFAGCIAGIHHVLQRQGLLSNTRCLDPNEFLSPGQADAIERIRQISPWMIDDDFVSLHRDEWLAA